MKVTEQGKQEMFSANLSIFFFLERHVDILFIGSFSQTQNREKRK